jgi:hypothetical protein
VCDHLNGRGTPSLAGLMDELLLEPVRAPFGRLVNAGTVRRLVEDDPSEVLVRMTPDLEVFAAGIASVGGTTVDLDPALLQLRQLAELASRRPAVVETGHGESSSPVTETTPSLPPVGTALALAILGPEARRRLDEWRLGPIVAALFRDLGADEGIAWRRVEGVRALASLPVWPQTPTSESVLRAWLADEAARRAIGVNVHAGVEWIRAEEFESFVDCAVVVQRMLGAAGDLDTVASELKARLEAAGYRADKLLPSQATPTADAEPEADARAPRQRQVEEVQAPKTVPSD